MDKPDYLSPGPSHLSPGPSPEGEGGVSPLNPPLGRGEGLELLRVGEAAEILRCSVSTVYRAIEVGHLRRFRYGRILLVRRDDLVRFVDDRCG